MTILDESPDGFAGIAKQLPRVDGKRISIPTLWRWATLGVRGVTLETLRLGGRYLTSLAAVERFGRKLAEQGVQRQPRTTTTPTVPNRRTAKQRERDIAAAKAELAEAGI